MLRREQHRSTQRVGGKPYYDGIPYYYGIPYDDTRYYYGIHYDGTRYDGTRYDGISYDGTPYDDAIPYDNTRSYDGTPYYGTRYTEMQRLLRRRSISSAHYARPVPRLLVPAWSRVSVQLAGQLRDVCVCGHRRRARRRVDASVHEERCQG